LLTPKSHAEPFAANGGKQESLSGGGMKAHAASPGLEESMMSETVCV
jgi:hypothetical protein